MTSANEELHHRVQELTRAPSALANLLEATPNATVFLDNGLKVMDFTPAVTRVSHPVETEGRELDGSKTVMHPGPASP